MVKIGMNTRSGNFQFEGSPAQLRKATEYALKELGTDYIDIVVLCRVDPAVSIEESTRGLKALVDAGLARAIGLSEASAANIRKAHSVHPIACIEQEYSVWTRDIEDDVLPTCRELGIAIVAYSPLGRGFLAGACKDMDSLGSDDYRKTGQPRLVGDALASNNALLAALEAVAARKGCTVGQLSLAWVHAQGPDVFPIPGTTRVAHLRQNLEAARIALTPRLCPCPAPEAVDRLGRRRVSRQSPEPTPAMTTSVSIVAEEVVVAGAEPAARNCPLPTPVYRVGWPSACTICCICCWLPSSYSDLPAFGFVAT